MQVNLFWKAYKNLEKDVLDVTNYIHFTDCHKDVYSLRIAELIVRAAIEIESISKELYEQLDGDMHLKDVDGNKREPFFDTECLKHIDKHWKLSKKKVYAISHHLFFLKDENRILRPLREAHKRKGVNWNRAYQAIKHNRSKEIKEASIKHLIRIMAALFLLNIYYKTESVFLGRSDNPHYVPSGSELFSVDFVRAYPLDDNGNLSVLMSEFENAEAAVYITKITEESKQHLHNTKDNHNQFKHIRALQEREYEAVAIKPDMITFHKSKKCIDDYTEERLILLEERANNWKTIKSNSETG